MINEEDRYTRLDSAVRDGGDYWLTRICWLGNGQSQTIAIAGQQQERAAMFIQRYATFVEAGLNYYEVTINKDLDSLSAEEAGARKNNVFINLSLIHI